MSYDEQTLKNLRLFFYSSLFTFIFSVILSNSIFVVSIFLMDIAFFSLGLIAYIFGVLTLNRILPDINGEYIDIQDVALMYIIITNFLSIIIGLFDLNIEPYLPE